MQTEMTRRNNLTTGRIYADVIAKEREEIILARPSK